jgi:hypothetical protein
VYGIRKIHKLMPIDTLAVQSLRERKSSRQIVAVRSFIKFKQPVRDVIPL